MLYRTIFIRYFSQQWLYLTHKNQQEKLYYEKFNFTVTCKSVSTHTGWKREQNYQTNTEGVN